MRAIGTAHYLVTAALLTLVSATAQAAIHTETLEYKCGDATCKGFLAYDESMKDMKMPGVLIAPEWWGLNDYARSRARQMAELGYVTLAMDIYGDGKSTTSADEAGKLSGAFRSDPALLRRRAKAGYDALAARPEVDSAEIAATGYCFGGTTVLELAYSGAPLAGVVTFHAGLTEPKAEDVPGIRAKFLILHGADDTFETPEQIAAFQDAMRKAGLDWQMVYFGGAVHSFSNPAADSAGMKGVAYNEKADRRSWEYMKTFLAEVFAM